MIPRGIRNCNPGNLERNEIKWRGMAEDQSSDKRFVVFEDPIWGIRAMARILKNGYLDGRKTIRQQITRWAPPTENNTAAYIAAVSHATGIGPDEVYDLKDLPKIVAAIIRHENGQNPYTDDLIRKGVDMA